MQAKGMTNIASRAQSRKDSTPHPAQTVLPAKVISAERTGLRSSRDRTISAVIFSSVSNCAWLGAGNGESVDGSLTRFSGAPMFVDPSLINKEEQLPAMGCRSTASSTVGVCSTARRKRNQVVNGMRRAAGSGRSPRSRAINPKPPLSSSRSEARRTCSRRCSAGHEFSPQRPHSNRSHSTLAAATDCGSRASLASTSAQNSPRRVAAASAASNKVVRPEEAGPQISVRQPRGRPPVSASMAAIPLETISGVGRAPNREAGVMPASLESAEKAPEPMVGTARCGGRAWAPEGCGPTSAPYSSKSKTKGRLWAAEVETSEDIDSSGNFRERRGGKPRRHIRFLFALENSAPGGRGCQAENYAVQALIAYL